MANNYRKFTKDDKDQARNIDVMEIGEQHGFSFTKDSNRWYRCNEHDSFVVDAKTNSFHWNSQNIHGSGGISFATEVLDYDFQGAMKMLIDGEYKEHDTSKIMENENNKQPLNYDVEEEKEPNKVKAYLENERGLDSRLVNWGIKTGVIAQDERNNACFKWIDNENNIVGVDKRGTTGKKFQQVIQGSQENYGFHIDILQDKTKPIEHIVITESPIDALSYYEAHKDLEQTRVASMSGVKENALLGHMKSAITYNKSKFPDQDVDMKLTFAVDNDEAGKQFISNFLDKWNFKGDVKVDIPEDTKDWNEQLKKDKAIAKGERVYQKDNNSQQKSQVIENDNENDFER